MTRATSEARKKAFVLIAQWMERGVMQMDRATRRLLLPAITTKSATRELAGLLQKTIVLIIDAETGFARTKPKMTAEDAADLVGWTPGGFRREATKEKENFTALPVLDGEKFPLYMRSEVIAMFRRRGLMFSAQGKPFSAHLANAVKWARQAELRRVRQGNAK